MENSLNLSRIIGILAFVATLLSAAAGIMQQINPKYAVVMMAVSGAISAFTQRIHTG